MAISKPAPRPDEVSEPFWRAIQERRLRVQRCLECKRFHHPAVGMCPECLSTQLAFADVSGRGTVVSYTVVQEARQPAFTAIQPYVVAAVRLAEQADLYFFTNLPGVAVEDVASGMPVAVVFEEITPDWLIPQFTATHRKDG